MEVEEKLTDDEDDSYNDKSGETEENSKSNSILERYLIDSVDALQIEEADAEDFTVKNHTEIIV